MQKKHYIPIFLGAAFIMNASSVWAIKPMHCGQYTVYNEGAEGAANQAIWVYCDKGNLCKGSDGSNTHGLKCTEGAQPQEYLSPTSEGPGCGTPVSPLTIPGC